MQTFAHRQRQPGSLSPSVAALSRNRALERTLQSVNAVLSSPGRELAASARAVFPATVDLSRVRVHTDAQAASSAESMNARAYTVGNHIAFGRNEYVPETSAGLSLLAHEFAHVFQQKNASASPLPTLRVGSPSHPAEREAEAFARAAAPAWTHHAPATSLTTFPQLTSSGPEPVLRCAPKASCAAESWAGCFTTARYAPYLKVDDSGPSNPSMGADIHIDFAPNEKVDATKIAFVQTVQFLLDGKPANIYFHEDENHEDGKPVDVPGPKIVGVAGTYQDTDTGYPVGQKKKQTELSRSIDALDMDAPGAMIDNFPRYRSPLAGLSDPAKGSKLSESGEQGRNHFGHRFMEKGKLSKPVSASFEDNPKFHVPLTSEAEQKFETAALAVEGAQEGAFYGSVQWGWKKAKGEKTPQLIKFDLLTKGVPSPTLRETAKLWNASKATTDEPSIPLPEASQAFTTPKTVALLDAPGKGKKLANLAANTSLEITGQTDPANKDWRHIVVIDGPSRGKVGWLKQDTLSDRPTQTKPRRPGQK